MRTFHLTVAYDGTDFSGWQVQPGKRTVQGEIERVVTPIIRSFGDLDSQVRVIASGRTDAGVHAKGQVARLVLPTWNASNKSLAKAINSKLPDDVVVTSVRETHNSFHPIADAIGKAYRYRLRVAGSRDPFSSRYVHRVAGPLNTDAMNAAASLVLGTHDFAAFETSGAPRQSTVRTITRCEWFAARRSDQWALEIEGDGFLYNMVRNLVGTMLEIGRGKQPSEWIVDVLRSKNRRCGGTTAAACGLCLMRVHYPPSIFIES